MINKLKHYSIKEKKDSGNWILIDAEGQTLGRMASNIAMILMGKNKPGYISNDITGDFVVLINASNFEMVDKINQEYPQIFPNPGWVEHNLNDIWNTVEFTVSEVLKKNSLKGDQIKCIGITNQRETTCAFDNNGTPLHHAIVWQDRRTVKFCKNLVQKGFAKKIQKTTGLVVDSYFSASKINWLLKNVKKKRKEDKAVCD